MTSSPQNQKLSPIRRPTLTQQALTAASRMTERDRQLLVLLAKHQVLTTHQITRAIYNCPRVARRRVQVLEQVGLIDVFRPVTARGSAPKHAVITKLGGYAVDGLLDAAHATTIRGGSAEALAMRPDLAHLVGANDLFCSLAAAAREMKDAELELWWSERACARTWGTHVRPDGFGRWRENRRSVDFFLEYDTGVEHHRQVLAKLPGYASAARSTGIDTPVLFWLHSARRENELHRRLATAAGRLSIATAFGHASADPAGPIWRALGDSGQVRRRLIDIPAAAAKP